MKTKFPLLLMLLLCCGITFTQNSEFDSQFVQLVDTNERFEIIENRTEGDFSHLRLHSNKWLMCFLHWRPLTRENRRLSATYSKNLLLNFWGPNMEFTLTGEEGKTTINKHNAYYINADLRGVVKTRFIIWNCEESQRQFIADININKAMETPDVYLELQELITKTICCHGDCNMTGGTVLPSGFSSEILGISFYKPKEWKSAEYNEPVWYPSGVNFSSGSLWTLPANSEIQVDILQFKSEAKPTIQLLNAAFEKLQYNQDLRYENIRITHFEEEGGKWIFNGELSLKKNNKYRNKYSRWSDDYVFCGELALMDNYVKVTIVKGIYIKTIWGRKVDLKPDASSLQKIIREIFE